MHRHRYRYRLLGLTLVGSCSSLIAAPALAGGTWPTFTNETSLRLDADPSFGVLDDEEKDYAWGDVDKDGDIDLIVVRKQPFTTAGGRRNVLFMNEAGVLTDRTADYIPDFLDLVNDRDVILVDVNNDTWDDIVTAAACNGCNPNGVVDDNRLFLNLGNDGGGNWLGYGAPSVLIGSQGNNFCGVAAGDIDGDTFADLYFVSYNDSFEDQLLMGNGDGTFTVENSRLTSAMRTSGFGSHVVMADMDNDSDLDIVKSENGPVETFRNNGSGVFDLLDPTYSGAAYHFGLGHLDDNGLLDIIISDDGTDRYIMNNGSLMNGSADPSLTFPSSTGGFGSNSLVYDLNQDGFNDVLIADVDVDAPGCTRVSDILRNQGNFPNPSFSDEPANIPTSALTGVHDIAVFDLNGDTFPDLVIGTCNTTFVLINSPPIAIDFNYPNGLPDFLSPEQAVTFDVTLTPEGDSIEPGTPSIFISTNGGPYTESALSDLGGNNYTATIPGGQCTDRFDFYLSAQTSGGLTFTDPAAAPASHYTAISADGTELLFEDDLEGDVSSWTVTSDASLTSGEWEHVDPEATVFNNEIAAPADDATPDGFLAFVTENSPPGGSAASYDVDGGPTYLASPVFDLTDSDGFVTYSYWAFTSIGIHDFLTVEVSNDGGTNWTNVDSYEDSGGDWAVASFFISNFVTPTDQIRVRFSVCDCPNDSVTEAGIDDFRIETLSCEPVSTCPWDCDDGDGTVGILDFLALLAQWGQTGTSCDFDGGGVGILDFLELLANWGDCP